MIRTLITLSVVAALAGCSKVVPEIRYVEVPVAVSCATEPPPPQDYAFDQLDPSTSDIYDEGRALLIERLQRQKVEDQLRAGYAGCASLPPMRR